MQHVETKAGTFSVAHAEDGEFKGQGLRNFFVYRDLGIAKATGGRVGAHVIKAVPGAHAGGDKHTHTLDVQLVYVLKGWVRFWYEVVGEVLLEPGSCVHQPPRHRPPGDRPFRRSRTDRNHFAGGIPDPGRLKRFRFRIRFRIQTWRHVLVWSGFSLLRAAVRTTPAHGRSACRRRGHACRCRP